MTRSPRKALPVRPRTDRYFAASVAQYLHELSGRHADEREHARAGDDRTSTRDAMRAQPGGPAVLAGR